MSRAGRAGLLVSVALIMAPPGPIDAMLRATGISIGLLVWRWSGGARSQIAGLAGLLLLLHTNSLEAQLALIVCIGLACADEEGRVGALFAGAALAMRHLLQGCAWAWRLEIEFSRLLSRWVGRATGQPLDLGPSASGLELFILFMLLIIAARSSDGLIPIKRLGVAALGLCLFMALVPSLGSTATAVPFDRLGLFNRANEHLAPAPQAVARSMFGWSASLLALMCLLLPASGKTRRGADGEAGRGGIATAIAAVGTVVMAAFMIGMMAQADRLPPPRRPGAVVLLKSAAFDMNVPSPGRFGSAQAGMLGLLPRYLALDGHRVRVQEGEVTGEALADASVTIVALPASPYKPAERRALESYVRRGGSLLVLGDHTDLLGTMGPLNALTAGWGIAFQFDSAFASQREWAGCLDAVRALWTSNTGVGTGASLRIGAGVRPMIIGRFGLADAGNRSNAGRGANLGDYAYQPGEQLGDLVLAAGRNLGRGRVVVFGDTSSFQNLVLPSSYPFIAALFDELARPAVWLREPCLIGSGIAAAGLGILALAGSAPAAGGLALAVLASTLWPGQTSGPSPLDRLRGDARVALIDAGHLNNYAREFWHDESAGGLIVNLERAGYLPLIFDEPFDRGSIGLSALPVLLAPRSPMADSETMRLASHIEHGGYVLVAAGADEAWSVAPLLRRFNLAIGELPLGPVPILADMDRATYEAQRRRPQFRRAWPIQQLQRESPIAVRSLYEAFGFDIVVEAHPAGGGRLLMIADSDFLTDRVLENENGAWEGNVDLLAGMLQQEQGG